MEQPLSIPPADRLGDIHWSQIIDGLNSHGYILLKQSSLRAGPVESLCALGTRIGCPHFHKLSDQYGIHPIRYIPGYPAYANANVHELSLHTDGSFEPSPPKFMLMYCEAPAEAGGHSLLASGDRLYRHLRDERPFDLEVLSLPKAFTITRDDRRAERQVFTRVGNRFHLAYRNGSDVGLHVRPEAQAAFHYVGQWLSEPENRMEFKLERGDILIFDNTRMLHGRTAFPQDSARCLHGLWCDSSGPSGAALLTGIPI